MTIVEEHPEETSSPVGTTTAETITADLATTGTIEGEITGIRAILVTTEIETPETAITVIPETIEIVTPETIVILETFGIHDEAVEIPTETRTKNRRETLGSYFENVGKAVLQEIPGMIWV